MQNIFSLVSATSSALLPVSDKEKTLVIGAGEIGRSLRNVLSEHYDVYIRDLQEDDTVNANSYRVIHVCYPYSDKFIEITEGYIKKYNPQLTIIHSTVNVGTTRKLGRNVVHSPVNGRHPHLEEGIKKFMKFVGGTDVFSVFSALSFFENAGIKAKAFSSPEATELAKLMCTSYLSWNVLYMKEHAKECEKYNVPFYEAYTEWNNEYNAGYADLEEFRFLRPVLLPIEGPIGGHCCINNAKILDNELNRYILKKNREYEKATLPRKKRKVGESGGTTCSVHKQK